MRKQHLLTFRELKEIVDKCDELMPEKFKDETVTIANKRGDKWTKANVANMFIVKDKDKEIVYAGFEIIIARNLK